MVGVEKNNDRRRAEMLYAFDSLKKKKILRNKRNSVRV